MNQPSAFQLSPEPIDTSLLSRGLVDAAAGAFVSFEGRVRNNNEGRQVLSLEYEAYVDMAMREGATVIEEATRRFDLIGALCVHRTGLLSIGDIAVWIGAISGHREEAFAACRFIIDEVKLRVPIWKKEHYVDGSTDWVAPPSVDAP